MAITQQIACLPQRTIEAAAVDTAIVERILSFDLAILDDIMDLDWAPSGLMKLARHAFTDAQVAALKDTLEGRRLLNSECATGIPSYHVDSNITCLDAPEVKCAATTLSSLDTVDLIRAIPTTREAQREFFGTELPSHPTAYYARHLTTLIAFLEHAATRDLGLVQWWD